MEAEMMNAIRKNLFRAVAAIAMDTSVAEKIWAVMTGMPVVEHQEVKIRSISEELLAAAPTNQVLSPETPKKPTKPVEPKAPVKKEMEEESVAESEDTKLSPQQKLEKQKNTVTEKLDKLRARQGTAKQTAKQKEADPKEIAKLEEKLKELTTKMAKAQKPNFEKWTPTWTKHFKTAADAAKMEVNEDTKTGFVDYLNRLAPEEFKKPSYLEHAQQYFKQRAAAGVGLLPDPAAKDDGYGAPERPNWVEGPEDEDEDVYEVTYDGELYTVGERSRKVYKVTEEGDVPVTHLDDIKAVLSKLDKQLGK